MNAIKPRVGGKILIIPDTVKQQWRVAAVNTGQQELGITHNIMAPGENPLTTRHDDHEQYGHGMPVKPDPSAFRELVFSKGAQYNSRAIVEGSTLRVGLRADGNGNGAYYTVQLGPLDGPVRTVDIRDDFVWYGRNIQAGKGNPDTYQSNTGSMDSYERQARQKPNSGRVEELEMFLADLIKGAGPQRKCKGTFTIEAVPNERGQLSHWTVTVENRGDPVTNELPFIGTIAFDVEKDGKKGLDSMGVPYQGSRAQLAIPYRAGGYAVVPEPGAQLRIGVRGFGLSVVQLPAVGQKVVVKVEEMRREYGQSQDEFFDAAEIAQKRLEKGATVAFADAGQELRKTGPVVLRGDRAEQESNFRSPQLSVSFVAPTAEHPLGGWEIDMTSRMPGAVDEANVGFIGTLKLDQPGAVAVDANRPAGKDVAIAPPKKFLVPGERKTWFIPFGHNMNGIVAQPGMQLSIGTRGLGWFAEIPLPNIGERIDTEVNKEVWGLREDQVNRDFLKHAYVNQVKD
jgi:hypothetical protein